MPRKILLRFTLPEGMENPFAEELTLVPSDPKASDEDFLLQMRTEKAEGLLLSTGRRLGASLIDAMPESLRVISTASVGTDHIDLAAAARRGIVVTNTPDVLTDATADLALLLILNACRRGREYWEIMKAGWGEPMGFGGTLGVDLKGKTLGVFGMGRIGRAAAHRARAFGMKIAYHNRHRLPPADEAGATFCESLNELLAVSEVLLLTAPSTPETRRVMNADTLARLPRGAVLVNVARGDLVQEEDLMAALRSGHLRAAGLDVFDDEPHYDRRIAEFPQVFLTPHVGSATIETRTAMATLALENLARTLRGDVPLTPVR